MNLQKTCLECKGNYDEYIDGLGYVKTCKNESCDRGQVPMKDDEKIYVSVYKVTRHFGGHEEGGWWYNWFECLETIPTRVKFAEEIHDYLEEEYKKYRHGDIYSVLGGVDIEIYAEEKPASRQTRERPTYE